MKMVYLVHIIAGTLGLLAGYVALSVAKGGTLHRKSGMMFVYTMLTMAVFGISIALARSIAPAINIPAAALTFTLIITALTTVKPLGRSSRWLDVGAMLVAFAVGLTMLSWGFEAVANGGRRNGMPAFPFFMFGVVGMLAGIGDLRVMRSGPLKGTSRLARHLWRMCFALFLAALSFSVQIVKMLPPPFRSPAIIALPMLVVLGSMVYWLWRVRVRRSFRGIVGAGAPEPSLKGS